MTAPSARLTTPSALGSRELVTLGRLAVSASDQPSRYVLSNLCVAHGRTERVRYAIGQAFGGVAGVRWLAASDRSASPQRSSVAWSQAAEAWLEQHWLEIVGDTPLERARIDGVVLQRDYEWSPRDRLLIFLFGTLVIGDGCRGPGTGLRPTRAGVPVAVIKLQPSMTPDSAFAHEWAALETSRTWAADLRAVVPAPFAHRRIDARDVIVMGGVQGRSIYVEQHQLIAVAPHRVERHLTAAVAWLARFQLANRGPGGVPPGVDDDRDGPAAASHGDFWPRNLLINRPGRVTGVVDWEAFTPRACAFRDVFQFALSYAVASAPGDQSAAAFQRAFLKDTVLARAIRASFREYCCRTGVAADTLRPAFERFLEDGAEAGRAVGPNGASHDNVEPGEIWRTWQHQLRTADRSVFSG